MRYTQLFNRTIWKNIRCEFGMSQPKAGQLTVYDTNYLNQSILSQVELDKNGTEVCMSMCPEFGKYHEWRFIGYIIKNHSRII